MERDSSRESVLLGYGNPRKSDADANMIDSDIDFTDVFGGPPRRQSLAHEMRHSFGGATDSYVYRGEDETANSCGTLRSVRKEKPVFGDEVTNRRRFTTDDFFNDIFRGSKSVSSSPRRKNDSEVSPGSQVMSPARPLPPKVEPFGTSLPSQFSLPAKLTKGTDLPTLGSATRSLYKNRDGALTASSFYSYSPLSRSSSQANHDRGEEEARNETKSSHPKSLLSKESTNLSTGNNGTDKGGSLKKDLARSEVSRQGRQFHFSIYKWPNKGMSVVMPVGRWNSSRLKDKVNSEGVLEELPLDDIHFAYKASPNVESHRVEPDREETGAPYQFESLGSVRSNLNNVSSDTIPQSAEGKTKFNSHPQICLSGKSLKEIDADTLEPRKPKLKPLNLFLFDKDDEEGDDELGKKEVKEENMGKTAKHSSLNPKVVKTKKKPEKLRTFLDDAESDKASLPGPSLKAGDLGKSSRVKGKVKEFVKIFNQGAPESLSQSCRWKVGGGGNEIDVDKTRTKETGKESNEGKEKPSPDAPEMEPKSPRKSETQDSSEKNAKHVSRGLSGEEDRRESSRAPISPGDMDESFHVNFQVEELAEDESNHQQVSNDAEAIEAIDAKIRKWSSGKDGNIRSLLSTLHYVLWHESGWKPVPLVDMIEGNAVRRSYQKALLILHPDKLQQKGASSHQKYVAEKVFELLQEAWTHFNSLGTL